jgi:hypothetical protein
VHLRVAGFTIRVSSANRDLPLAPAPASSSFLVDGSEAVDVDVTVEVGDCRAERDGPCLFDSGGPWRLYRHAGGYRFEFVSPRSPAPYKVAVFDPGLTSGRVTLDRTFFAGAATIDPLEYPLDELLVISLLGRGRGVELHGCGVADGGDGHLFVGQSGAGKTTTARLWLDDGSAIVLSDDRIVVRDDPDGLWMYGTPWHGDAPLASPRRARVKHVFVLRQGDANALRPLSRTDAVARLFAACFPPFHDRAALDFTLGFLDRLAARVPVRELSFLPAPSLVEFVRRSG